MHFWKSEFQPILESVKKIGHVIVLCDDLDRMKAFYRDLFSFLVVSEGTNLP